MRHSHSYLTVLLAVFLALPVAAERSLLRDFADCTGRLSAEVEHSWLVDTSKAERSEKLYKNMVALLDSVTGPNDQIRARAIRVDAKAAHAKLLRQSAFGWDKELRRVAGLRAEELISACSALILAGAGDRPIKIWAVSVG